MNQNKKQRIAFIYKNACHPVSQTFADAIEAIPHKITGPLHAVWTALTIQNYKYYFIESILSTLVPITKRYLGKKNIIIFRGNDGLFGEKTPAYLSTKNPLKKMILLFLIKQFDGIITESGMVKQDAVRWTKVPIEICESYVENKAVLEMIKPHLTTNTFLFIGAYRPPYDHKNITSLIELFNDLPEYNLIVIGKGTKQLAKKAKNNIEILDRVKSTENYYKKATWYIHLPKYEAGPITLLEAMIAGLLPVTNTNAGHHVLIKQAEQELVLEVNMPKEEITTRIKALAAMPLQKRRKLSETFKKIGANHFDRKEMTEKFRNEWVKLVQKIKKEKEKSFLSETKR